MGALKVWDGTQWQFVTAPAPVWIIREAPAQSIADSGVIILTYNIDTTDGVTNWSLTTSELTIPVAGLYHIACGVSWASAAAPTRRMAEVQVVRAGAVFDRPVRSEVWAGTGTPSNSAAGDTSLLAGDVVRLGVYQNSGAALSTSAASIRNFLSVRKVG